jgi:sugar O-acyltransferase (sialic acid O-acetyltransferase NeuD family)
MGKIIVFGNSVFAEHLHFLLTHDSGHQVVAFTVDRAFIRDDFLLGLPVVPFENVASLYPPSEYQMTIAVSFQRVNRLREERYTQARARGYQLVNYVSSRASTFSDLSVGENCVILENAIIGPYVKIGNNVVIASGAIIGHHAVLNDHCFISPGAIILGGATLAEYCFIGANATVKEEVEVARECIVGSGVSITRNTVEKGVYLNPPPVLYPKRSDQLRNWLTWPLRARKSTPVDDAQGQDNGTGA